MPERDFEQLYQAYAQMVYWAAYGVSKNRDTAAETMQTVFLRVFEHQKKLNDMGDAQLKAWLYRVTINHSIDKLRKQSREFDTEDAGINEPIDESLLPEVETIKSEERRLVRESVDQLPLKYREPIMLYYFAQMSYHDIAQLLDMSEGTLKSRMARARNMLAKMLLKGGAEQHEIQS